MAGLSETVTLWRPVGPVELALIREADMRAFPPRLAQQPIFYPVLTEDYAVKIARDWNVKASGAGYVTRFQVLREFLERYAVQDAVRQALEALGLSVELVDHGYDYEVSLPMGSESLEDAAKP